MSIIEFLFENNYEITYLRLPLVARALGYHDPPKAVERHVDNYFMVQINEQPQRVGRFIHHFKRAAT